jgi:hypothetical protein
MGITQLALLLVAGTMFVPSIRQAFVGLGPVIGMGILFGIVALGAFVIFRVARSASKVVSIERAPTLMVTTDRVEPEPSPALTAADLIEQLRSIDWFQFEKFVALVYRKLGYAVARNGGANPDGGIDLVIEKNGQKSAVQCKQWKMNVSGNFSVH